MGAGRAGAPPPGLWLRLRRTAVGIRARGTAARFVLSCFCVHKTRDHEPPWAGSAIAMTYEPMQTPDHLLTQCRDARRMMSCSATARLPTHGETSIRAKTGWEAMGGGAAACPPPPLESSHATRATHSDTCLSRSSNRLAITHRGRVTMHGPCPGLGGHCRPPQGVTAAGLCLVGRPVRRWPAPEPAARPWSPQRSEGLP